MDKCKDCKYYKNNDTYEGTGYCTIQMDYVRENDTCEDYEER